jgi:diguanylate cyclase (GGDEF)-like protein
MTASPERRTLPRGSMTTLAAAALLLFLAELVISGMLLVPGLVPDERRPLLRTLDFLLIWAVAVLLLIMLLQMARLLKTLQQVRERQQALFDAMPTALALWGTDDRLELMNDDFRRLYAALGDHLRPGIGFEELMRMAVERATVPDAVGREAAWLEERLARHRAPAGPMVRRMADGRFRRVVEQRLPDGRLLSHSVDITETELARAEASLARQRLADAVDALPAGFELYDADDRLVAHNAVLARMYPRIAELLPQSLTWEALVRAHHARGGLPGTGEDFEGWLHARAAQRRSNGPPRVLEMADGLWVRTYESSTREGGIVGVRIDVSELMQRERELRQLNGRLDAMNLELQRQADSDALTGVANRRAFDRRLAEACQGPLPLSLLLLDVDHFKRFNDHHGHPAGDAVLRRVAAVLVAALRSPRDLVARIGGEEFAVVMNDADADAALATAERCLALLADADIAHGDSPISRRVTASIGVAHRADGDSPAALVARADGGLYAAKAAGRNRALAA